MDILDQLSEQDLTPDLKIVAAVCGMHTVREMLRQLQGMSFYIPRITNFSEFVDRYISDNRFKSAKVLSRELGVSEQYVRRCKKKKSKLI